MCVCARARARALVHSASFFNAYFSDIVVVVVFVCFLFFVFVVIIVFVKPPFAELKSDIATERVCPRSHVVD